MPDLIGATVGGYLVEAELGRGGQAVVYRATQISLQRVVALKVVSAQQAADPGFRERFHREGVSAARLDHPNVVAVYESGEQNGLDYLAMKFVDGGNLDDVVRASGRLPIPRALAILRQVADALDYAAARGVVHRDVKPANVLVGPGDHVYLTDFGLAKALKGAKLTQTGTWMGTMEYIAPEQVRGDEVTAAADRYALAVVAYELLAGRPPFQREDRTALLYAHLNDAPPAPSSVRPELSPEVDAVLARGLAKDPAARYPSARGLIDALTDAMPAGAMTAVAATTVVDGVRVPVPARPAAPTLPPQPLPGAAPPPSPPPVAPDGGRRRWLPWAIGGAVAGVAGVIALAVVLAGSGRSGGDTVTTFVTRPLAPPPTAGAATGPAFPTPAEAALLDAVPASVRASCERSSERARAPGALTSVHCRLRGRGIYYERFGGPAAAAAYYEGSLRAHGIVRGSGSCATRENVDGPYDQGGPATGRVACYRVDGDPWLVWTHAKLGVVSTLLGLPGDSPRQAYGVWKDAGPYR